MGEVASVLRMLDEVYAVFGLSYTCALSTRPDKFLGEPAMWDQAEQGLKDALASVDKKWEVLACPDRLVAGRAVSAHAPGVVDSAARPCESGQVMWTSPTSC